MSNLTIKQLDWQFDDVDFYFNPENRVFSAFMNSISFMAVGLERYFCKAMKDAEAHISDPRVLDECKMFNRQEMVHSKAHYKHCKALPASSSRASRAASRSRAAARACSAVDNSARRCVIIVWP